MLTRLIISPSLEQRQQKVLALLKESGLKPDHPDLLFLNDEEKLGVEATKRIRGFLTLKPYSALGRGVVVISAHKLTTEAQSSLLKTLEEPPIESVIILGAESDYNLLPTVLSRCQIEYTTEEHPHPGGSPVDFRVLPKREKELNSNQTSTVSKPSPLEGEGRVRVAITDKFHQDIEKLINSTIEDRFEYIEKLEAKEAFLQALVLYFNNVIAKKGATKTASNEAISKPQLKFLKNLLQAEEYTKSNVNLRAILEYLMLNLP